MRESSLVESERRRKRRRKLDTEHYAETGVWKTRKPMILPCDMIRIGGHRHVYRFERRRFPKCLVPEVGQTWDIRKAPTTSLVGLYIKESGLKRIDRCMWVLRKEVELKSQVWVTMVKENELPVSGVQSLCPG
jgi:hypothetical protein